MVPGRSIPGRASSVTFEQHERRAIWTACRKLEKTHRARPDGLEGPCLFRRRRSGARSQPPYDMEHRRHAARAPFLRHSLSRADGACTLIDGAGHGLRVSHPFRGARLDRWEPLSKPRLRPEGGAGSLLRPATQRAAKCKPRLGPDLARGEGDSHSHLQHRRLRDALDDERNKGLPRKPPPASAPAKATLQKAHLIQDPVA